ncbi:MAG: hypothetical protein MMC23_008796 [Stictis urceolatum]|nr:hypothetical protein [Stictis urceolata]
MEAIQPAHLSFLTIYNPALGNTDETLHEQVVYYWTSKSSKAQKSSGESAEEREHEEQNERLRQIGLAQGMVEFAKAFSDGESIDAIDAEKSRILLHELEPGWWLLASVDLTRLQHAPSSKSKGTSSEEPTIEFSSREVSPQDLMLQQLLRAHSVFLLHQAATLSDLWVRLSRQKFCHALERFWNRFIRDWEVLFHGSPAVDIFDGLKLAAGGELGIGVGEEEWGSGEREVLEGFIDRTEGLTDVVVSRFGEPESTSPEAARAHTPYVPWLGSGATPSYSDGVIFSGIGAVTRECLQDISTWMQWIYKHGSGAYGVSENPNAPRRKRRRKPNSPPAKTQPNKAKLVTNPRQELPPGIPPPIARAVDKSLGSAISKAENKPEPSSDATTGTDTMIKYMTLGIYGSTWGIQSGRPTEKANTDSHDAPTHESQDTRPALRKSLRNLSPKPDAPSPTEDITNGTFLIGLLGNLDLEFPSSSGEDPPSDSPTDTSTHHSWNHRILVRTLHIELSTPDPSPPSSPLLLPLPQTHHSRLRVVLYARRPFLFAFLFAQDTPTLSYTALYRSLHHQLEPLQKPLLRSTDPEKVRERVREGLPSQISTTPATTELGNPIFDILFDPHLRTVHSTLPAIPEPGTLAAEGLSHMEGTASGGSAGATGSVEGYWTRADALNVHQTILGIIKDTRRRPSELERTVKTGRGWWVVWMRLPPERHALSVHESSRASLEEGRGWGDGDGEEESSAGEMERGADAARQVRRGEVELREAVLVRRAGDHPRSAAGKKGWMGGGKEGAWAGAGKVVEGIGVDARRYVEGLLSLSR